MATKDDRPGLLSKVALFVRNPTKDWSELGRVEDDQESGYDKHALKAMIERKRQNDFVRKREFDQLRKLRSRGPVATSGSARPSFFQSSMATDPEGRLDTLKKIDEIEAQMSKQWWKGKQDASAAAQSSGFPVAKAPADSALSTGPSELPTVAPSVASYAPTEPAPIGMMEKASGGEEFASTQMGSGMEPAGPARKPAAAPLLNALTAGYDSADVTFSTSKLFAIEVEDMATDPELEEAAIRFANGDYAGAESSLLDALRMDAIDPEMARSWTAALLDLYRATHNRAGFDSAAAEFAYRLDRHVPKYCALGEGVDLLSAEDMQGATAPRVATGAEETPLWVCQADLTEHGMELLRNALSANAPPWLLDWSRLQTIASDAVPLMAQLFGSLCNEPVALRFRGVAALLAAMRQLTPNGDRTVSAEAWQMHMDALRAMHLQDEFELAALDYCITFEVSPPAWVDVRCQFERVDASVAEGTTRASLLDGSTGYGQVSTEPVGLEGAPGVRVELSGQLLGDATQALAGLNQAQPAGELIVVACHGLVRVDFSAAGSILNWVATRQAEGCTVQFRGVHRLVAAFFNVIGINEHAKVVPRQL